MKKLTFEIIVIRKNNLSTKTSYRFDPPIIVQLITQQKVFGIISPPE